MDKTKHLRVAVDVGMTGLLFLLMAYQLTGGLAHEWAGAAMLLLFIIHHILDRRWIKNLGRGTYGPIRILQTGIDLALLVDMLVLMVSGIILSRHVFSFLAISGGVALARQLHLLCAHWGFVMIGLHLGLHWGMVVGRGRRAAKLAPSRRRTAGLWILAGAVGLYGAYAFWQSQFWRYLFLQAEFVFVDLSRPAVFFFADHLAMLELLVLLAYGLVRLLQLRGKGNGRP